jgi:predicted flap endonuclease-1-like 5' DNA nuclease
MTWKRLFLLAGAALILWLRPWRQLRARRVAPAPAAQPARPAEAPQPDTRPAPAPAMSLVADQGGIGGAQETPFMAPEDAFGAAASDELPADAALEAAFSLDANLDLTEEPDEASAFGTDPAPAVPLEAEPVLDADLIALGEPEPVEMAEDELMDLDEPAPVARGDEGSRADAATPDDSGQGDDGDDERTRAVGTSRGRPDDLLLIEGIGPRVSTIVYAAGFRSFADLAAADPERLRSVLADAGIKNLDPSTWAEQARLAAEGRMDELKELQGQIKNGKKEQ